MNRAKGGVATCILCKSPSPQYKEKLTGQTRHVGPKSMMKLRTCLSLNRASGGPQCGSFQRHGPDLIGSNLEIQAFRH